jgi:hypothetical protein
VLAHQGFEKHLVDFVVGRPVVADNVVGYRFDEFLM